MSIIDQKLVDYTKLIKSHLDSLTNLEDFYDTIFNSAFDNRPILVFGNGGSAAIADHLACDWTKGVNGASPTYFPRVLSLCSNQALLTAIANDYGYEYTFSKQIAYAPYQHAIAIAISSSGNSENIIQGLKAAASKNYTCMALVGFDGGRVVSDALALNKTLHVKSYNYGIVEDSHSIIMHVIAQRLAEEMSIVK